MTLISLAENADVTELRYRTHTLKPGETYEISEQESKRLITLWPGKIVIGGNKDSKKKAIDLLKKALVEKTIKKSEPIKEDSNDSTRTNKEKTT